MILRVEERYRYIQLSTDVEKWNVGEGWRRTKRADSLNSHNCILQVH